MRTSRVHSVTSGIFRNSRQYLQTNEQVFRLLDENRGHNEQSGPPDHGKGQQKKPPQKQNGQQRVLSKNHKGILVKGIQSDAYSMSLVHNILLQKTSCLNNVNKVTHIRTYQTSI